MTDDRELPVPSEVRLRVLEDHGRLRIALSKLRRLAQQVGAGLAGGSLKIRRELRSFADQFFRHLQMEEEVLLPVLRNVDSWGKERAERVLEEHREQRQTLLELLEDLDRTPQRVTRHVRHVLWLCDALEADMLHEEAGVLSESLLRDDVVVIDGMGG